MKWNIKKIHIKCPQNSCKEYINEKICTEMNKSNVELKSSRHSLLCNSTPYIESLYILRVSIFFCLQVSRQIFLWTTLSRRPYHQNKNKDQTLKAQSQNNSQNNLKATMIIDTHSVTFILSKAALKKSRFRQCRKYKLYY